MLESIQAMFAWAQAHPETTAFVVLGLLGLLNIAWAQLPKPASPGMQKAWVFIHDALQLVVTHSSQPGTFTLPSVVRLFVKAPDPFGEIKDEKPNGVDPPGPPATVG